MIINIFSAYVVTLLKDINHSALLQEWKISIDAAEYEIDIDANMSKPSDKIEIDHRDSDLYCPTTIIYTIHWFPFIAIMEHTANILKPNNGLITSLLNDFAMFELRFIDDIDKVEAIDISCINSKKSNRFIFRNFNIRRNDY